MDPAKPPPFDLQQLRYFRAVAAAGSISAAARALRMTQPTLSASLAGLERSLGTRLMQRGRDGIELTSTGEELVRHADELLAGAARAFRAVRGLETDEAGTVTVACPDSLGELLLPDVIAELARVAPGIHLSIWNDTSRAVERAVLARQAEFGLVSRMVPHPEFVAAPLFDDATELVVRGRPARSASAALARVRRGPLVYVGASVASDELIRRLAENGGLPGSRLACGTMGMVKAIALAGVGLAILPGRVARHGVAGRLVTLHPSLPRIPDTITLIHRADLHRTAAALRVKQVLLGAGKRLRATP